MKKIFFWVAAVTISSSLYAQDSARSSLLDDVIVTANKAPQKQSSTGKVITVISKSLLEKSAGKTIGQVLNEQAGLTINGSLNTAGSNQTIYMRGAATGRTLILIDGVPAYDPSFINTEFDLNLVSLNDVERIEICKGAQSTLYGSDAVAGVINIITIDKDVRKPVNVKSTIGYGSFNTFRANAQVYGRAGKWIYSARFARMSTEGFSAAYDSTGKAGFDRDGYLSNVASASLQYNATPFLSVRGFVHHTRYRNDVDASVFTDEKDFRIRNRNLMAGASFHYQKNKVILNGIYQYSDIYRHYRNDSSDVPGFTRFSTDDYYGKTQYLEIYSNIKLDHGFSLLQGADFRYSSMNNQFLSISSFGPFTSGFRDTVHSQASAYFSVIYNGLNEKLNIEWGGRLNVHSRYGTNSTFTFNPSYRLSKHWRVFGSIASAFKAPSLYQLYSDYGNPDLKPEYSNNYEIGIQQQNDKWQGRLVYLHRDIRNGLDFNNIVFQYFNFSKQVVRGLELELSYKPLERITLNANYTYLHPSEESQSRITFKDTTYKYLLKRPQHTVNATIGYNAGNAFFMSVSGKYVSKRYDFGGYQQSDVALGAYFILGAYLEYRLNDHIKLFTDWQNLTDKKFFDIRGYNSIPFCVNGGVTVKW